MMFNVKSLRNLSTYMFVWCAAFEFAHVMPLDLQHFIIRTIGNVKDYLQYPHIATVHLRQSFHISKSKQMLQLWPHDMHVKEV